MTPLLDNVRATTRGVQKQVANYRPESVAATILETTFEAGPRKRHCHSGEWFWTGVIVTLATVALALLVIPWPT